MKTGPLRWKLDRGAVGPDGFGQSSQSGGRDELSVTTDPVAQGEVQSGRPGRHGGGIARVLRGLRALQAVVQRMTRTAGPPHVRDSPVQPSGPLWGRTVERNDIIAWAMASFVWLGALALFVWLGAREQPRGPGTVRTFRVYLGSRIAGGLLLWATVFSGARWMERRLEVRPQAAPRAPVS